MKPLHFSTCQKVMKIRAYLGPRIPRIPRATRVKCFSQVALQLLVHFFACILVRQSAHYTNLRWLTQNFELIQLDPSQIPTAMKLKLELNDYVTYCIPCSESFTGSGFNFACEIKEATVVTAGTTISK